MSHWPVPNAGRQLPVLSEKQHTTVCALAGRFVPPPKGEGSATPEPFAPVRPVHRAKHPMYTALHCAYTTTAPTVRRVHWGKAQQELPHSQQWTSLALKHSCGPSTTTAVQGMARICIRSPRPAQLAGPNPHFQLFGHLGSEHYSWTQQPEKSTQKHPPPNWHAAHTPRSAAPATPRTMTTSQGQPLWAATQIQQPNCGLHCNPPSKLI
jgi:hypothetical protein